MPTNEEWIILESFLGSSVTGLRLKCNGELNDNGKGNPTGKFSALLGGYRGKEGGFSGIEEFTYLASSAERTKKLRTFGGGVYILQIVR